MSASGVPRAGEAPPGGLRVTDVILYSLYRWRRSLNFCMSTPVVPDVRRPPLEAALTGVTTSTQAPAPGATSWGDGVDSTADSKERATPPLGAAVGPVGSTATGG